MTDKTLAEIIERIEGMKYLWEKPIDEIPSEWFHHNQAIESVLSYLNSLKKEGNEETRSIKSSN